MIEDVTKRFDLAIKTKFKDKPEIQSFLLKHERKNLCINRLCEQIVRSENYNIKIHVQTYDSIIEDIAMMFARACLQKHEEEHYSSIKLQQIMAQHDHIKNAEAMIKDLEKEAVNERGLTEIERDEIKQAIKARPTDEVQT
jgi:hypothetical protein